MSLLGYLLILAVRASAQGSALSLRGERAIRLLPLALSSCHLEYREWVISI